MNKIALKMLQKSWDLKNIRWTDLESLILSEVSQTERDKII